jgi:hypothetical protein
MLLQRGLGVPASYMTSDPNSLLNVLTNFTLALNHLRPYALETLCQKKSMNLANRETIPQGCFQSARTRKRQRAPTIRRASRTG